jgi:hypothetical protein
LEKPATCLLVRKVTLFYPEDGGTEGMKKKKVPIVDSKSWSRVQARCL